jgi:hypothetical protein
MMGGHNSIHQNEYPGGYTLFQSSGRWDSILLLRPLLDFLFYPLQQIDASLKVHGARVNISRFIRVTIEGIKGLGSTPTGIQEII